MIDNFEIDNNDRRHADIRDYDGPYLSAFASRVLHLVFWNWVIVLTDQDWLVQEPPVLLKPV